MFLVYYLSVGVVGSATVDMVSNGVDALSAWAEETLTNIGTSEMLVSLITDGIIAGVGAVLRICTTINNSILMYFAIGNNRIYVKNCTIAR